jgi:very-short-patch-repair endonuclease
MYRSKETKLKISKALTGRKLSKQHRLNISKSRKGKPLSIQHKLNLSKSLINHPYHPHKTEQSRQNSLNAIAPYKFTKNSKTMLGKHFSEEHKRKIGTANKLSLLGKKMPEYVKEKIRQKRILYMQTHPSKFHSKSETVFLDKLEQIYNIKITRNFLIENRIFDGKYNDTIIEIDGEYWHNQKQAIINDEYKTSLVYKNNYKLLRIKLNSCKEIDNTLIKYKQELDKCFYKPS